MTNRFLFVLSKVLLASSLVLGSLLFTAIFIEISLRVFTPDWLRMRMKELNVAGSIQGFNSDSGWSVEMVDQKFLRFKPYSSFRCVTYEYDVPVHIDSF